MNKASHFNKWVYSTIQPYLKGKILEAGSGIGNISAFCIEDNYQITLTDSEEDFVSMLKEKFGNFSNVNGIFQLDLVNKDFQNVYKEYLDRFDSVFYLNVLEHIENDRQAVVNSSMLLKPGGTLIILVPAYSSLFSKWDKQLGHFRRYTARSLRKVVENESLTVKKVFYFNALGIAGWLYAKMLGKKDLPKREMSLFNKIVFFAKLDDKILLRKMGLSVIAIATKTGKS